VEYGRSLFGFGDIDDSTCDSGEELLNTSAERRDDWAALTIERPSMSAIHDAIVSPVQE
jgi:hypothetical protein